MFALVIGLILSVRSEKTTAELWDLMCSETREVKGTVHHAILVTVGDFMSSKSHVIPKC